MASTSGSGGAGSSEGADKKGKAVQKRDYRKGKQHTSPRAPLLYHTPRPSFSPFIVSTAFNIMF